jgi:histone acetyltransferase (RNA polymerase elongator complex component)
LRRVAYFIPFQGCGRRCIYCDQTAITGDSGGGVAPEPEEIRDAIAGLKSPVELCFFGGSFAKLTRGRMINYLDCVRSAPPGSVVTFSSYPGDFIGAGGEETVSLLRDYPIGTIELGIPSLDPLVLKICRRDDDPEAILGAAEFLRDNDFRLGVQIMIGLPNQTFKSVSSDIAALASLMPQSAWDLRLYPCLVLRGSELERLYERGEYRPKTLEEAVRDSCALLGLAESLGFNVIRVGLHDSRRLRDAVVAGPYHPAFGELVASERLTLSLAGEKPDGPWEIPARRISQLTGHGGRGIRRLAELTGITPEEARARLRINTLIALG